MRGAQNLSINAHPELIPSPFPNWSKPVGLSSIDKMTADVKNNLFNKYWELRNEKEWLKSIAKGANESSIKGLSLCAMYESKSGLWRVASNTFTEAILLMQKLDKINIMPADDVDFIWVSVSTNLRDAGFYVQGRHVLKNMKNRFFAEIETNVYDKMVRQKLHPEEVVAVEADSGAPFKKDYRIRVPAPPGAVPKDELWEDSFFWI